MNGSQPETGDSLLVSIVIIFLNVEAYLEEAINSVLRQTYPHWELLLVDDGSTDGSRRIATECRQRHPHKIRYLEHGNHENRGMSASRNLGLNKAKGNYITFLDGDDVWLPNHLSEQSNCLKEHPRAAMVYGPVLWWYSWSGQSRDQTKDFVQGLGVAPDRLASPPLLLTLFLQHKAGVPSGMLLRRQVAEEVGGFENQFRGAFEDQVFCSKICLNYPVFVSGTCTYLYRQHPSNSCKLKPKNTRKARFAWFASTEPSPRLLFLTWLSDYLRGQSAPHPSVWKAIKIAQWQETHPALSLLTEPSRLAQRIAGIILPVSLHRRLRMIWHRQNLERYKPKDGYGPLLR